MRHLCLTTVPAAGLILALLGYLPGVARGGEPRPDSGPAPHNVILVVVCTLRGDHTSISGYPRDTTPNLRDFAEEAFVFNQAYASAPWTLPSYTSLLLGRHAFNHDFNRPAFDINFDQPTLVRDLRRAGYATVSVQVNSWLPYLDLDFDERLHYLSPIVDGELLCLDRQAVDGAIEWIVGRDDSPDPFFLFLGLMSPHWPYRPNSGYLEEFVLDPLYSSTMPVYVDLAQTYNRETVISYLSLSEELRDRLGPPNNLLGYYLDSRLYQAAYDGEVKYLDEQIGRLLQVLKEQGLFDSSTIIITADHGENMVDHLDYFHHGDNLHNSLLHVPLLIKLREQQEKTSIGQAVRIIDIFPTIFDILDITPSRTDYDGKSLIPVINQDFDPRERPVIGYRPQYRTDLPSSVSLVYQGFKLFKTESGDQLYDLALDPREQQDLALSRPETVDALNTYLSQFYPPRPGGPGRDYILDNRLDYDGDGTSDLAVFRPSSGLWAVRGITRAYFGAAADLPVPGDYTGDGTAGLAIFRDGAGFWAVRGITRAYFGAGGDLPVPGDYAGEGTAGLAVFRATSGLWAIRGLTRAYFGRAGDLPVPGYYTDDGKKSIGIFRPSSGLWVVRGLTRTYFGKSGDIPVPGDYSGDGTWSPAIYRPVDGLWAVRGVTRVYFGTGADIPVPGEYRGDGVDRIGSFRPGEGLWKIRDITRVYFGSDGDLPAAR